MKGEVDRPRNTGFSCRGGLFQFDRVDSTGVSYVGSSAVTSAWWKGKNGECDKGYALLILYSDRTIEREYVTDGWVVRKWVALSGDAPHGQW